MTLFEAKLAATAALIIGLLVGYQRWHHHVYQQGYTTADTADRALMKAADDAAKAKVALLNGQVALAQKSIDETKKALDVAEKELGDAKVYENDLESKLRSGARRLSVLVSANQACPAGPPQGAAPAGVDNGAEVRADLDPNAAAEITGATDTGDDAIRRLNGCIQAYDAVKAAADQLGIR
jgi:hypothetical protein